MKPIAGPSTVQRRNLLPFKFVNFASISFIVFSFEQV